MTPENVCRRCRGTRVIGVKHGQIFETDSADEALLAYHDEPCPECAGGGMTEKELTAIERRNQPHSSWMPPRPEEIAALIAEVRRLRALQPHAGPPPTGDGQGPGPDWDD